MQQQQQQTLTGQKRPLKEMQQSHAVLANEVHSAKEYMDSETVLQQRTEYIKNKLDNMSEEQLARFEFFVRSHFPREKVKQIMEEALGADKPVSNEMIIVVSGLAKLFVGEVCDTAADVMKETSPESGIQVDHIKEAYRRLQKTKKLGIAADNSYLFQPNSVNICGEELGFENL